MDVLSDVLATTRVSGAFFGRVLARAPWGLSFDGTGAMSFHIVVRGSCYLRPRGADVPVHLQQGGVMLLPRGGPYSFADHPGSSTVDIRHVLQGQDSTTVTIGQSGPESEIVCGEYQSVTDLAHPLLAALPPLLHLPAATATRDGALQAVVRLLTTELDQPGPGTQAVTSRLVDTLLVYILRTWQERTATTAGWVGALRDPHVGQALVLMHQSPGHRWTVARLATAVELSRATFARRFTALVGAPPLAYLTNWRMTTAAALLREIHQPLSAIADHVGYDSEFAFARAFRRTHGQSPGRYRASARGLDRAALHQTTGLPPMDC